MRRRPPRRLPKPVNSSIQSLTDSLLRFSDKDSNAMVLQQASV
jgi:hypothetical protein